VLDHGMAHAIFQLIAGDIAAAAIVFVINLKIMEVG